MEKNTYYVNMSYEEAFRKASDYIDASTSWSLFRLFDNKRNKFTGTLGIRVINITLRNQWSFVPYKTIISYNPYENGKCSIVVTTKQKKYYMKLNIILMIASYTLIFISLFFTKYSYPYYLIILFVVISIPNIYFFNKAYMESQTKIDSFIRKLYSSYFINN